jgi:hypothetical protein
MTLKNQQKIRVRNKVLVLPSKVMNLFRNNFSSIQILKNYNFHLKNRDKKQTTTNIWIVFILIKNEFQKKDLPIMKWSHHNLNNLPSLFPRCLTILIY